jgi:hypothetical protein
MYKSDHNEIPVIEIVRGYSEWVHKLYKRGYEAFMVTFMFKPLRGRKEAVVSQMQDEVDRVFATFITRITRNPNSIYQQNNRPLMIVALDRPVKKNQKKGISSVSINDGVHMHGILLVPPVEHRPLKGTVTAHFKEKHNLYVRNRLRELHVEPIKSNIPKVVDYVMKSVKARHFDTDDISVFPRERLHRPSGYWIDAPKLQGLARELIDYV